VAWVRPLWPISCQSSRRASHVREMVMGKIEAVAGNPYAAHNNVTRLQGRPEFRLRVQDWRVIYRLLDDRVMMLVIKIGGKGQVYE
jgi:mRNA interferase RelE/StbE